MKVVISKDIIGFESHLSFDGESWSWIQNPEKEDLESGSRAAAAGGITSFLDMPNTSPNAINRKTIEGKIATAAKKSVNHHGFFIGATNNNVSDLQSVEGMDGVCGIKIFMGSSTGDLLVHEQKYLENI